MLEDTILPAPGRMFPELTFGRPPTVNTLVMLDIAMVVSQELTSICHRLAVHRHTEACNKRDV